jgi:hypothetical protein
VPRKLAETLKRHNVINFPSARDDEEVVDEKAGCEDVGGEKVRDDPKVMTQAYSLKP